MLTDLEMKKRGYSTAFRRAYELLQTHVDDPDWEKIAADTYSLQNDADPDIRRFAVGLVNAILDEVCYRDRRRDHWKPEPAKHTRQAN